MAEYRGKGPNANYFGDRPMTIHGRVAEERERLHGSGMTMDEREWREKWCKDQELAPEEPKYIPELDRLLTNPIQRLYKTPLNYIFLDKLGPVIGERPAYWARHIIPKGILGYLAVCGIWWMLKYNEGTWERQGGWVSKWSKPIMYPGDTQWPHRYEFPRQLYASKMFYERKVLTDVGYEGTSTYHH
ncbi:hypothetical protein RvY_00685 [Ramazzottius varieornatus]|uniref:Uncharacterized protein n=1 Tax=Ramazzottius varieornatus TaxID=947166 RepID=A0A1D1UKV0_RAMVA|nr:hypothetical protein RvY_00685 [Ramazzottius varieornatus]